MGVGVVGRHVGGIARATVAAVVATTARTSRRPSTRGAARGPAIAAMGLALACAAVLVGCAVAPGDGAVTAPSAGRATVRERSAPVVNDPAPVTVNLVMVGDVLPHPGVYHSGERGDGTYNFDHLFAHVAADVAAADLAIVNQETVLGGTALGLRGGTDGPLVDTGDDAEGGDGDTAAGDDAEGADANGAAKGQPAFIPVFNSPQEIGDAEVAAGFDVVLKATNHAMDMGYDGLRGELAFWRGAHPEVAVLGAVEPGTGTGAAAQPYVYEKDGLAVAVLNFANGLNGFDDPYAAVALLTEANVRDGIRRARELADVVVVCPHWGVEYETTVSEGERAWADIMLEEGADVVIGTHPHVIQPVEVLVRDDGHRMLVFWSLGNFVSFQLKATTMVGGMAKVSVGKDADGTVSVGAWELDALVTHRGTGTGTTTYKLADYTDELAAANSIRATDATVGFTRAWCCELCRDVLGAGFDDATGKLAGTL